MMDRAFLAYYEEELGHLRGLAAEFADLHPEIAANLSLAAAPCPDPYVERLLEGVAYLAARTRQKLDAESSRHTRAVLDALYPDLVAPTPAAGIVVLEPGKQVETMPGGHSVARGTRLVAGLRPSLATRATYTTAQAVALWPIEIAAVRHLQDRSALVASGFALLAQAGAESALGITLRRTGPGALSELALDRLDVYLRDRARAPAVLDACLGASLGARARTTPGRLLPLAGPGLVGLEDGEALMPATRRGFEGYRLLREYFIMPERFHFLRFDGLRPAVAEAAADLEIVVPFRRATPELSDTRAPDLALFATPAITLFERDCNLVEVDPTRPRQILHADRTRPRDFEIYRVTAVEDAGTDGPAAALAPVFALEAPAPGARFWWMERRPRRAAADERSAGRMRASYAGDDAFLALSGPAPLPRRLAVRALCTNRDLPLLDDQPGLAIESGDPVARVTLLGTLRPPRPSLPAAAPGRDGAEGRDDELTWRLVGQLSLNYLGLAAEGAATGPIGTTLALYADRGDPALARHARAIAAVTARPVIERLPIAGPLCFGRGTEVTLDIDETQLAGHSRLLLGRLLAQLFARYAAVNAFVHTRTRLLQSHEEGSWPLTAGNRSLL